MRNFRQSSRGGFGGSSRGGGFSRGGDRGGGRGGGFSGRGRSFGGRDGDNDRGPAEMHDAVCSKCGKKCQVPFKPTGNKPVFCSDCFRQNENGGSSFAPRNQNRQAPVQTGISQEQFKQLNEKLDKILLALQNLEIDADDEDEEDDADDVEDEDEEEDSDKEETETKE
jgi:CxxC-x17-CxxC domain-containing protein